MRGIDPNQKQSLKHLMRPSSPLRYPGGKSALTSLVSQILVENRLQRVRYGEPFAGGCGLALNLLFDGLVSEICINDIDASIWAFWHSVLNETDELCDRISSCEISVEEWERQRNVQREGLGAGTLELGFSTFFLNRTNRSGVIKEAGVIGGKDQSGPYKIDCRFNRLGLTDRIKRIARYRDRIHLTRTDALDFLKAIDGHQNEKTFLCIDPPYFTKGASLYTSFYGEGDHVQLAHQVLELKSPWIVTYDNSDEIRQLYRTRRTIPFDIRYSLETKRIGTELLVASKHLRLPKTFIEGNSAA